MLTDALRANLLEQHGYEVQILEFIDMEHTPKNLLIRAIKNDKKEQSREQSKEEIRKCEAFLHVKPTLGQLLKEME